MLEAQGALSFTHTSKHTTHTHMINKQRIRTRARGVVCSLASTSLWKEVGESNSRESKRFAAPGSRSLSGWWAGLQEGRAPMCCGSLFFVVGGLRGKKEREVMREREQCMLIYIHIQLAITPLSPLTLSPEAERAEIQVARVHIEAWRHGIDAHTRNDNREI